MPTIYVFDFDDDDREIMALHGISIAPVEQTLYNSPLVVRNRRGRRGTHLVIGMTDDGQCIATPIEPTHDPIRWRPITAWHCKPSEAARLRNR